MRPALLAALLASAAAPPVLADGLFVHTERPGSLAVPHDHAAARSLGTPLPQLDARTRAAVAKTSQL